MTIPAVSIDKAQASYNAKYVLLEGISNWVVGAGLGFSVLLSMVDQGNFIPLMLIIGSVIKIAVIHQYKMSAKVPLKVFKKTAIGVGVGFAISIAFLRYNSEVLTPYLEGPMSNEIMIISTLNVVFGLLMAGVLVLTGIYRAYSYYLSDPETRDKVPTHLLQQVTKPTDDNEVVPADSVVEVSGFVCLPVAAAWADVQEWVSFQLGQGNMKGDNPLCDYELETYKPAEVSHTRFRRVVRKKTKLDGSTKTTTKIVRL